jgi:hypothetical protein
VVLGEKSEQLINMKRLNLGILGALVVLAGCSDGALTSGLQDETTGTEVFASKGATTSSFGNPLGEPGECSGNYRSRSYELLAGQKKLAGFVNVSTDGNFLYVTYDTSETADLKEVHVNVYTDATDVPTKRPAPGQAPYKAQNLFLDSYTVSIPLSDFNLQGADLCGFTFYVIAHAALTVDETGSQANAGETAYSGGNNNLGKGAWFYISEYTVGCAGGWLLGFWGLGSIGAVAVMCGLPAAGVHWAKRGRHRTGIVLVAWILAAIPSAILTGAWF